jgi:hypothetical protein
LSKLERATYDLKFSQGGYEITAFKDVSSRLFLSIYISVTMQRKIVTVTLIVTHDVDVYVVALAVTVLRIFSREGLCNPALPQPSLKKLLEAFRIC